jgi:choline dehydrogenase-like flavoprotein
VHDLPGVGCNLQDHLDINLNYRANHPDLIGTEPASALALLRGILPIDASGVVSGPAILPK